MSKNIFQNWTFNWIVKFGCVGSMTKLMPCKFATFSFREESLLLDIQPDELHVKMQDPNFMEEVQLIDVREPDEVYACNLCTFNAFKNL